MNLLTYNDPVQSSELALVLSGDVEPSTTSLELDRPIESVITKADELIRSVHRMTEKDAKLAPVLHEALEGVPRRHLTDCLFWHWMTTSPLKEFVVHRWPPKDGRYQVDRYLGKNTLAGVNGNALARLYWTAEATHEDDSYELTEMVLTNADLHVQIFDSLFGLEDRLVKTCIRLLNDVGEAVHRKALLLLRVQIRNTVIEALDGEQLETLVSNCLTLASGRELVPRVGSL
jgi:hypothetical protein